MPLKMCSLGALYAAVELWLQLKADRPPINKAKTIVEVMASFRALSPHPHRPPGVLI